MRLTRYLSHDGCLARCCGSLRARCCCLDAHQRGGREHYCGDEQRGKNRAPAACKCLVKGVLVEQPLDTAGEMGWAGHGDSNRNLVRSGGARRGREFKKYLG